MRANALLYCSGVSRPAEFGFSWSGLTFHVPFIFWALLGDCLKAQLKPKHDVSCLCLNHSYPLLKLPLPGTGPVEYSTPVKDYSPPSPDVGLQQGDLSERPDWVSPAPGVAGCAECVWGSMGWWNIPAVLPTLYCNQQKIFLETCCFV